jgi:Na+-translocating ferredoxin:NAD+ oxidoreductase RnfD subunit
MTAAGTPATPPGQVCRPTGGLRGPFLHAPERAAWIYLITALAACGPLAAGAVLFGWRALAVTAISVATCVLSERLYFRLTRTPALLGRTHAYLTGLLLALTLPPFVPWYVPLVGAVFATILGKAVFGGVGHFLWQPALVGRLAVAVLFAGTLNPASWPLLSANHLLVGDIRRAAVVENYRQWRGSAAPAGYDAMLPSRPVDVLAGLAQDAAAAKARLFAKMRGRCFMVAAGTGNDFPFFPPRLTITAVWCSAQAGSRRSSAAVADTL